MTKQYKAKVSATVELEVILTEKGNGDNQPEIKEVLKVTEVSEFANIREIPVGRYGGTPTLMRTLDVGTKFHVCNGMWDGEIILKDGHRHILIDGDKLENAHILGENDDRQLDIIIK